MLNTVEDIAPKIREILRADGGTFVPLGLFPTYWQGYRLIL